MTAPTGMLGAAYEYAVTNAAAFWQAVAILLSRWPATPGCGPWSIGPW